FLDQRSRQPPDKTVDSFEYRACELRDQAKHIYQYKTSVSIAPIFTTSLSNITLNSTKCEMKIGRKKINFGSPEWLRAKKLKNPGRICHTGLIDTSKRVKSEAAFNWNILSRKILSIVHCMIFYFHPGSSNNISRDGRPCETLPPDVKKLCDVSLSSSVNACNLVEWQLEKFQEAIL
ncbi:unnamed protein product, partial [Trichobilharzia regenti]